jgi:iron complex outermembrane receptor protein
MNKKESETPIKTCALRSVVMAAGEQTARIAGGANRFHLILLAAFGLSGAPQVWAQQASGLEEIVVTAQKHASTVLETPISITAIGGDDIQGRGITSFSDLAASVPGVSMRNNGPGQTEFEMRGITSSGGNSPTVGFYLDDAPLTAPAAAQNGKVVINPTLYDLDRVEVLRGPQGTLYGSGSMGGTIKLITNQPNLTEVQASSEAILSGTEGGGFNHGVNAMINLPLVNDRLALRIVGSNEYTSGWIDRIVVDDFPLETNGGKTRGNVLASPVLQNSKDVNDERRNSVRVAMTWKPSDSLTITPSIFYQTDKQGAPNTFDSVPGTLAHYEPFYEAEPSVDRFTLLNLSATYSAQSFDITSVTSKWLRESVLYQDASESTQLTFGVPAFDPLAGGLGPTVFKEDDPSHQWSEEIRISSRGKDSLTWVLGGFYSDFGSSWNVFQNIAALPAVFGSPTTALFTFYQPTTIKQKAVFGEATYAVTDQLKLTAGLRWFSYDASFTEYSAGFGGPTGSDTPFLTGGSQTANGVDPKFNLSYQPSKDQLVYATVAKGFRPGGPNQPIPNNPATLTGAACLASLQSLGLNAAPANFESDTLWSYEIGEKTRLFDNRLDVNASIYYEKWSGIQQQKYLSCGFPFTDNAGNARVYGAELEIRGEVATGLVVSASGGYTNAAFTENVQVTGTVKGQPLPDVPTWTGNLRMTYSTPLPHSENYKFLARLENTYTGSREDATYTAITPLPAYDLTNARAGISAGDRWTAWLFIDNVFNKRALLENATALSFYVPDYNRVLTNQPLTAGVDLNYRF